MPLGTASKEDQAIIERAAGAIDLFVMSLNLDLGRALTALLTLVAEQAVKNGVPLDQLQYVLNEHYRMTVKHRARGAQASGAVS